MSKRKLEEYYRNEEEKEEAFTMRLRKNNLSSDSGINNKQWSVSGSRVQLMVTMIPNSIYKTRTLVVRAYSTDTISVIGYKLESLTGFPFKEQRFIYSGKYLNFDNTLAHYSIGNDSVLHLVYGLKSTLYSNAWRTVDTILSSIYLPQNMTLESLFSRFFNHINDDNDDDDDDDDVVDSLVRIFLSSCLPEAIFMLYVSPVPANTRRAISLINSLLSPTSYIIRNKATPILLHFCKLFRSRGDPHDVLYLSCRAYLADMLPTKCHPILPIDFLQFAVDLGFTLTRHFIDSPVNNTTTLLSYVSHFSAFLLPLRTLIKNHVKLNGPISMSLVHKHCLNNYGYQLEFLHTFFLDMFTTMDKCLHYMQVCFDLIGDDQQCDKIQESWPAYLPILKQLNALSKLFVGTQDQFQALVSLRKVPIRYLILTHAKRNENNNWLLKHKQVTTFECRRHLAMMTLPDKDDYEQSFEMLIDRSQLLAESFEYITNADARSLRNSLFMEFKNEEATGPGVVREWFCYVCQAIFNQPNALFVACPSDRRRFYPNSASKVNPLHLKYFKFCGRVIALALMHKVQIGIVLDRVFFVQLAGMPVSLEDIRDADPCLYNSCKQILEMDSGFIDTDALGLTFVREIEELGSRRVVELCPGGENLIVNSRNREDYVNLLIKNYFVTSISGQVDHFAKGFADILLDSKNREFFFKILKLRDLDRMLHGSESGICVKDWKTHTDYSGYKASDPQILWFWKVVGEMSEEQKKILLFFWTSVKYLPIEGFKGLASRLYISKITEVQAHLPSSHTCFYQLCFPAYESLSVMEDRLRSITREHVGYSFGTW